MSTIRDRGDRDREDRDREDEVILRILEGERPAEEGDGGADDEGTETLQRLYTEVLGLLPYELEPMAPSQAVKERLMRAIAADEAAAGSTASNVAKFPQRSAAASMAPRRSPRARVWAAVAAAVVLLVVAAGGFWTGQNFADTGSIADLRQELERAEVGRRDVVEALREASPAMPRRVEVCPLLPTGERPQRLAFGNLVLLPEHGRWHVRIHQLEPARGAETYILWFLLDGEPVKKIVLGPALGHGLEAGEFGLPVTMNAAALTLEPTSDSPRPTGRRVLYGEAPDMEIL